MILTLLVTYLIASIPFGLILARLAGAGDVRAIGSGNIGATNVLRTGRKGIALATLLLDGAKGAVPFFLFPHISPLLLIPVAISGHVFPVWLKFKGGKGVATALGAILVAYPYVGIGIIASWLMIAWLSRTSAVAALIGFAIGPLFGWWFYSFAVALLLFGIWGFLLWTHRDNIRSLLNGRMFER